MPSRRSGAVLATGLFLAGCAGGTPADILFEGIPAPSAFANDDTADTRPASRSVAYEDAPSVAVSEILSHSATGDGFAVGETARSDGRYYLFRVRTEAGSYTIRGQALMEKHLRELRAVAVLRDRSRAAALARGAGEAVASPVVALVGMVANPANAARNTYANARGALSSARDGMANAARFVSRRERSGPKVAEREKDGFGENLVGRPVLRRKMARDLGVDPYTHYTPLQRELDLLSSFASAGRFGVNGGIAAIPGVGGIVVSGVTAVGRVTERVLDSSPKQMAGMNRKRFAERGFDVGNVNAFLLNSAYTPSEKTIYTGLLVEMDPVPGYRSLLSQAATARGRTQALEHLQSLAAIVDIQKTPGTLSRIDVLADYPVVSLSGGGRIVIAVYDLMAWVPETAARFDALADALDRPSNATAPVQVMVTGRATKRTGKAADRYGWILVSADRLLQTGSVPPR
ncbi:MAG: hypothetical protein AAGL24_28420 [Pseudomonadota bacterium]